MSDPNHVVSGGTVASRVVELADPEATLVLGRDLGRRLFPGAVVALVGQLGAGKTQLTRGLAQGLGVVDDRVVTSPTFVLLQEYHGRLPIYHFDTYRLTSEAAFDDLGVREQLEGDGVSVIEWADRVASILPEDHLRVTLTVTGPIGRRALLEATGPNHLALLPR
ncbi:MAG: tRNA (adenosine(37)-N6)-threonylcarbamoyltransferase complex ATPase subunit type 1 TsaE [Gemmataceae bacterium]